MNLIPCSPWTTRPPPRRSGGCWTQRSPTSSFGTASTTSQRRSLNKDKEMMAVLRNNASYRMPPVTQSGQTSSCTMHHRKGRTGEASNRAAPVSGGIQRPSLAGRGGKSTSHPESRRQRAARRRLRENFQRSGVPTRRRTPRPRQHGLASPRTLTCGKPWKPPRQGGTAVHNDKLRNSPAGRPKPVIGQRDPEHRTEFSQATACAV